MNQSWGIDPSAVMPLAVATGLFVSLCSIQAPTTGEAGVGPSGAPAGTYTPVSGLQDIVCMDAPQPPSEIKLGAFEARAPGQVMAVAVRHVLLDSYYPTLIAGWRQAWRAVVDGTTYDIRGVEWDSQKQMIRLDLHLATAGEVQA